MRMSDGISDVCSSDLFSRIVTPDRLGAPKRVESFEASPAERAAVARRLELLAVDRLAAELTVTNVGGRLFRVEGPWEAAVQQACVVTLEPVPGELTRSEEHTSELQSLMRISYAVFCLKKKKNKNETTSTNSKI